ncbi:hypothetical protein OVA24_07215 [Luteolibacter sp. SL250]|uniref:hypothetical protein n=1 Tax=Luteolibacter sp. SL250 TaxID=2995170 RepID=UPI00226E6048|nr:hypothetical protein [Luteolibacter sp. SL250]WAC21171.1 hypothetical protein OVA24_07215 [Luteolibacter sp. SL250]
MNAPLTSSGSFDPLSAAGGSVRSGTSTASSFKAGQFVRAAIDNTAFFSKRPKGDADADKLLPRNTEMKVISVDSSYVKVELDSGEVGFVPAVMVQDPNAVVTDTSGMVVYPPLPAGGGIVEPLPNMTPTDVPPGGVPPVISVDPSAPVPPAPAATGDPSTAPGTSPAATPAAPAAPTPPPLPPGGEDVSPGKESE